MSKPEPVADAVVAELVRRFSDRLASYIRKHLHDPDEVKDVVQDTFLRVLRHRSQVAAVRNPGAWLHSIARSALIDHVRRKAARTGAEVLTPAPEEEDVDTMVELAACVEPLIRRLPLRYRDAVAAVDLQGATHAAVARRLNVSVSAIKSRTQRGRRMLKHDLVARCGGALEARGGVAEAAPPPFDHCCPTETSD